MEMLLTVGFTLSFFNVIEDTVVVFPATSVPVTLTVPPLPNRLLANVAFHPLMVFARLELNAPHALSGSVAILESVTVSVVY